MGCKQDKGYRRDAIPLRDCIPRLEIAWPTIWFALWHFAPGSVSQDGNPLPLVIGSGFFGLLLGFLAWKTDSIFWCIVAHVVGGLIIVL